MSDEDKPYLLDDVKRMAAESGRSADVLIVNTDKIHESNTYNFVLHGDSQAIAGRLVDLLPKGELSAVAEFYKQLSYQALTVIIDALRCVNKPYNCLDLTSLLTNYGKIKDLELEIQSHSPKSNEAENLSTYIDQFRVTHISEDGSALNEVDSRLYGISTSGVARRIFTFGIGRFGQIFDSYTPEVVLSEAIIANKIVYISIPKMGKDIASTNLRKLVTSDIRSSISTIQEMDFKYKPNPTALIFFNGNYENANQSIVLPRIIEQSRGANIGIVLLTNSEDSHDGLVGDEFVELI